MVERTWVEKKKINTTLRYLRMLRRVIKKAEGHREKVWKYHVHNNMTFGTDVTGTDINPKQAGI